MSLASKIIVRILVPKGTRQASRRRGSGGTKGAARRLVCVVEGHGEVEAIPCLCSKIRDHLEAWSWFVDDKPIRQPRSKMVDESSASPMRTPNRSGIERALLLAAARPADAVVLLCDSDDDCPAEWGPAASSIVAANQRGGAVMIVREFEAWLLYSRLGAAALGSRPVDSIRDARGQLKAIVPGYKPTVHQLTLTRQIDVATVWGLSDSFDKLVRTLAKIFEVDGITRPLPLPRSTA